MRKASSFLFSGALALAIPLSSGVARADLSACGDIHVEARAECQLMAKGGCEADCSELNFEAACSAEGYAQCDAQCSGTASASCEGSCDIEGCEARCEGDPGRFDCEADCSVNCSADCAGECDAQCGTDSECKATCKGSCEATCDGECKGQCDVAPPSASCEAKCEASCQGECTAKSNIKCQTDCQADLQVDCRARLEGGCVVQCERPEGQLVCDGKYVDHGNNAQQCLDAIQRWKAQLQINAMASGMASCQGGKCKAEGEASASCALGRGGSSSALLLVALTGAVGAFRRRRSRK